MKKHWYQILQDINNATGNQKQEVMKEHYDLFMISSWRLTNGIFKSKTI